MRALQGMRIKKKSHKLVNEGTPVQGSPYRLYVILTTCLTHLCTEMAVIKHAGNVDMISKRASYSL